MTATTSTQKPKQTAKKPCGCGGSAASGGSSGGASSSGSSGYKVGGSSTGASAASSSNNTFTHAADSPDCGCGCGCGGHKPAGEPCCTDICFERPNYFCGHLLTDDDLTTGQRYFREKNKLYHRALDGNGIVCGLNMKRDLNCPNNVVVGEGFAIDACGNDLVVCEPQSFNVISAIRKMGYLAGGANDPCVDSPGDDCRATQCFWVAARYCDHPSDFESPLQSACSPGPSSCEATRIQETVTFEVLDTKPKSAGALDELIERFECCFNVLSEGTFATSLKFNAKAILALYQDGNESFDYFNIFCQLKAYFLQHIRRCPDPYDALLESDVQALPAPAKLNTQPAGQTGALNTNPAANANAVNDVTPETAICGLFSCVWRYIADCLNCALVFPCPTPSTSGEVILGTVELRDGKLARICHCDRSYVWSAANFWNVLVAYLMESAFCSAPAKMDSAITNSEAAGTVVSARNTPEATHCCPEPLLNCKKFFELFAVDQESPKKAVLDSLALLTNSMAAAKTAFNVMDPNAVPQSVFNGMKTADAQALAQRVGVTLQVAPEQMVQTPSSAFDAIMTRMLVRPGDTVTATAANGQVTPATISAVSAVSASLAVTAQLTDAQTAISTTQTQVEQLTATAAKQVDLDAANQKILDLTKALSQRDSTINSVNTQITALTARIAKLEPKRPSAPQGD